MRVLEKVAKTMSQRHDIKVSFRGSRAYMNAKEIVLPALPEDESGYTEKFVQNIRGYCDHETGHVRYSSTDIFDEIEKCENPQIIHMLTNVIEDVRIEKLVGSEYAGAKQNMNDVLNNVFGEKAPSNIIEKMVIEGRKQVCGYNVNFESFETEIKATFGEDIFDRIAKLEDTRGAFELAKSIVKQFEEKSKEEEKEQKEKEQSKLGGKKDGTGKPQKNKDEKGDSDDKTEKENDDAGDKGRNKKDEGEESDTEENDEVNGAGADKDSGENSDDENEGVDENGDEEAGDSDMDNEDDAEGENSDAKSDDEGEMTQNKKADKEAKSSGKSDKNNTDERKDIDDDKKDDASITAQKKTDKNISKNKAEDDQNENDFEDSKAMTLDELGKQLREAKDPFKEVVKELEAEHKKAEGESYMVLDKSQDKITIVPEAADDEKYNALKREAGNINVVAGKMANMFLTRVASKWMNDREQGKVNSRGLCRVKAGYTNVFREKYVSQDASTAVSFLVDFSGSMGCPIRYGTKDAPKYSYRIEEAMKSVVVFLESLHNAKVKAEVLGYTTGRNLIWEGGADTRGARPNQYGRVETLLTYVFKAFGEPMSAKIKRRISNYSTLRMKENCDPESVLVAYQRLIQRPEKRKVLFVLTDGVVANNANNYIGREYLKEVVKNIEKTGVEVIAIGIDGVRELDLKQYYSKTMACRAENLADSILSELKKVLKIC